MSDRYQEVNLDELDEPTEKVEETTKETKPATETEKIEPAKVVEETKVETKVIPPVETEDERKANARLAYKLRQYEKEVRELKRKQEFMEAQRQSELEERKHEVTLADRQRNIETIRVTDPDLAERHQRELDNERLKHDIVKEVKPQVRPPTYVEDVRPIHEEVNMRLVTDFPDVADQNSDLFRESRKILLEEYSEDEITHLVQEKPTMFYKIVEQANTRLEIRRMKESKGHEEAEVQRKDRVGAQGAPPAQPAKKTEVNLGPEELKWCKKNGYDPKEYAKYYSKFSTIEKGA